MHEFFKNPFKVGEGIKVVAAHLLDEGVDDGAAPAGFFTANEHPVFHAELGGTDRSFSAVVVKLDLTIEEAGFKVAPLIEGVVERFPKVALGKNFSLFLGFTKVVKKFFEMVVVSTGLEPAGSLPVEGSDMLFFERSLNVVDFCDLVEDPVGDHWVVVTSFPEFPADVGETADGDDRKVGEAFDKCAVGAEAVALEVAAEGGGFVASFSVDEDVIEAVVGSAFVPVK